MELIVAEKPKVAYTIAKALHPSPKRITEGKVAYYEFELNGEMVVVAPAVGHLFTLAEKNKTNSYPVFDIEWKPTYETSKSSYFSRPYVALLKKLGKEADLLTVACDYDIEGTLIGYNVYRFCYGKKDAARMKFSALVPSELKDAYANKGELDLGNAHAGEARHILDWYYGINLSRALMSCLKTAGTFRILSIGRVQGPALNLLAEKEDAIKKFVSEPYWEVYIQCRGFLFLHKANRFFDEEKAKKVHSRIGKTGIVANKEVSEKKIPPYPPFDLTSLQTEAYRTFGFSPTRTLKLAQNLYEDSLISYPRTSSQKLSAKLNLPRILQKLAEIEEYAEHAGKLISEKRFRPMQGKKDDPAHPAIHPTGQKGKMDKDEKKLYDLIVKRFLSVFASWAKSEITHILIETGEEPFTGKGIRIIEKGWIEYYSPYYKSKEVEIPFFEQKEQVEIEDKEKKKKKTKPPARYTPASIISELEKRNLGTKATRAAIIETLVKREYITGRSLEVTDFGIGIWKVLKDEVPTILDEELTRSIESKMVKISEGKIKMEEPIEEGRQRLISILSKFKQREKEIGESLKKALKLSSGSNVIGKCGCGGDLKIIKLKNGNQFVGCSNYPNCRQTYPLPSGSWVTPTGKTCKECGKPIIKVSKNRKFYQMCVSPACPSKANWGKKKDNKEEKKKKENKD
ncbi:DNA topoisomerase I [Candidatus Micrarchaeota archaeon]|nr:DNA topoisomerase I [Candidatus Micrarchaeota archaeon]